MGDMSKHFSRYEIACECGCGFESVHPETLRLADEVRDFVGAPIAPSSGARCCEYNRLIGSTDQSQHTRSRAMDLPVSYPRAVYDWLCESYPDAYGFGLYRSFVHIDSRRDKSRWGNDHA